jgi:spermidine synthase
MTKSKQYQYSRPTDKLVYMAFFISGMAGLIYEISWSRQMGLLFGHTVQASATVVGGFFAGMGIGYALAARLTRRVNPLLGYAVAEGLVAVWACVIPLLLGLINEPLVAELLRHPNPAVQTGIRLVVSFLILLPATVALGTTLPFIAEYLSPSHRPVPKRIAKAYAINTWGALLGVVSTTTVLLVTVGVKRCSWLAAGLSVLCAGIVYRVWKKESQFPSKNKSKAAHPLKTDSENRPLMWVGLAALSGFGILALQVLYTRLFALVLHNSTYTFGAVLTVFLGALAIGAGLVHRFLQRAEALTVITRLCVWGALAVTLSLWSFGLTTKLDYFNHGGSFSEHMFAVFALVGFVVGPPIVILGMILPATWYGAQSGQRSSGRTIGNLTAVNTFAATLGSLGTAFVLIAILGLWGSFLAVTVLFLICGTVLRKDGRRIRGICMGLVVVCSGIGAVALVQRFSTLPEQSGARLLKRWETAYGWLDIVGIPERNVFALRENIHYVHGDTLNSAAREFRQGHLPLCLHPNPSDVLFLGLGTGMTASAALDHPEAKRIVAVELIPEVVEAVDYFRQANGDLLHNSRVSIEIDDARHWLLASRDRFDVIVSDLFVPWQSQSGYLYTVEHYQAVRSHLAEGGLFCQWLTFNQVGRREFETIANSFASVFPSTTLWWGRVTPQQGMVMLVGSEAPFVVDAANLNPRLESLNAVMERKDPYLGSIVYFCRLFLGCWSAPTTPVSLNTDEHPRIEFLTPLTYRNRDFLTHQSLITYFDDVLTTLGTGGIRFSLNPDETETLNEKHALQRQVLMRQMTRQ